MNSFFFFLLYKKRGVHIRGGHRVGDSGSLYLLSTSDINVNPTLNSTKSFNCDLQKHFAPIKILNFYGTLTQSY